MFQKSEIWKKRMSDKQAKRTQSSSYKFQTQLPQCDWPCPTSSGLVEQAGNKLDDQKHNAKGKSIENLTDGVSMAPTYLTTSHDQLQHTSCSTFCYAQTTEECAITVLTFALVVLENQSSWPVSSVNEPAAGKALWVSHDAPHPTTRCLNSCLAILWKLVIISSVEEPKRQNCQLISELPQNSCKRGTPSSIHLLSHRLCASEHMSWPAVNIYLANILPAAALEEGFSSSSEVRGHDGRAQYFGFLPQPCNWLQNVYQEMT